jgi:hypothetical protein
VVRAGAGPLPDLAAHTEAVPGERRVDGLPELLDELDASLAKVLDRIEAERRKLPS